MTKKNAPDLQQAGTLKALELALEIERIRKADPEHYAKIMRKFAEIKLRQNK